MNENSQKLYWVVLSGCRKSAWIHSEKVGLTAGLRILVVFSNLNDSMILR